MCELKATVHGIHAYIFSYFFIIFAKYDNYNAEAVYCLHYNTVYFSFDEQL